MTAAQKLNRIPVEDYLAAELISPVKHEYLGGVVYAMAGARNVHNDIAVNALTALRVRLRGKRCKPCNSDTKIRLFISGQYRFYYPDVSVTCNPSPPHASFQDKPVVIVEVFSRATRRIDDGEKKDAYLTIPSLSVYLLVEQESAAVTAYRRTASGFAREEYEGLEAVIPLGEIDTELPLAEIYEGVTFVPEEENEAEDL
jgi:Uma2 family endonuclease